MTLGPHGLTQALHVMMLDRDRMMAFREGDDSVLPDGLGADERQALTGRDMASLYRLGVHPLLVFHLSAVLYPREHYVRTVVPKIQGAANPFYDYYTRRCPAEEPDTPGARAERLLTERNG